jgi:hypothetical protein
MRALLPVLAALTVSACVIGTSEDANDRFPTSGAYPPGTMERIDFTAGVPEGWRISALRTPERPVGDNHFTRGRQRRDCRRPVLAP